jgi:aspartokinase|tara:strand:- start:44114 stop:44749 length:636 start_codon:yes stop_codon:yes gene_type:complete
LVKKLVSENTFLLEAISKDLISYGNLAEQLKPEIEKELGKKVKEAAIVMALRRYAEELHGFDKKAKFKFKGEIIMRTNIMDFNIVKSNKLSSKIKNLYSIINFERGDILNIILGNNEVSIITNEKYREKISNFLKGEKILNKEHSLAALSIIFSKDDFFDTPGAIFTASRKLAWEQINIFEIVSTMTELTFILSKKDSMKAYNILNELIGK